MRGTLAKNLHFFYTSIFVFDNSHKTDEKNIREPFWNYAPAILLIRLTVLPIMQELYKWKKRPVVLWNTEEPEYFRFISTGICFDKSIWLLLSRGIPTTTCFAYDFFVTLYLTSLHRCFTSIKDVGSCYQTY